MLCASCIVVVDLQPKVLSFDDRIEQLG